MSLNGLYYFCNTKWWHYKKTKWLNWDLCSNNGETGKKSPEDFCRMH
jgi:hypothetical protein